MAITTYTPSMLRGAGTRAVPKLATTNAGVTTILSIPTAYLYFFQGNNLQTDWNVVINSATSPNITNISSVDSAGNTGYTTGRGSNSYLNARIMLETNLSSIPGTITDIKAIITFGHASTTFDINIYGAGTTSLEGGGGEYSYYKDAGSTAFASSQTIVPTSGLPYPEFTFPLNSSALTIANTKPSSFVIAAVNEYDYTATPPTPLDTIYQLNISAGLQKLEVTYVV